MILYRNIYTVQNNMLPRQMKNEECPKEYEAARRRAGKTTGIIHCRYCSKALLVFTNGYILNGIPLNIQKSKNNLQSNSCHKIILWTTMLLFSVNYLFYKIVVPWSMTIFFYKSVVPCSVT